MPAGNNVTALDPFAALAFREKELEYGGTTWKFRELSVQENDSCLDAAKKEDGTIDGRINMRMLIVKSSVEPKITLDALAKIPNRAYLAFAEFVNDLNSFDDAVEPSDDPTEANDEGNA